MSKLSLEDLTAMLVRKNTNSEMQRKQIRAHEVGNKAPWELTKDDRKYYGKELNRGKFSGYNKDGQPAFNVGGIIPSCEQHLACHEASVSNYVEYVQDYLYRKFMGYDLPFFRVPKNKELVAAYNQVALDMDLAQYAIPSANIPVLEEQVEENDPVNNEAPMDDAEFNATVVRIVEFAGNYYAPIFAESIAGSLNKSMTADQLMATQEFHNYLGANKQVLEAIFTGKLLDASWYVDACVELVDKHGDDKSEKKHQETIAEAKEIIAAVNAIIGMLSTDKKQYDKDIRTCLSLLGDAKKLIGFVCSKADTWFGDKGKALVDKITEKQDGIISVIETLNKNLSKIDVAEVLDKDGNPIHTVPVATGKANGDGKRSKEEKDRQEKQEKAKKDPKDTGDVFEEVFESGDTTHTIHVSRDRHEKFKTHNAGFIKDNPGLINFQKMLPEDSMVKFNNYKGLVSAELYRVGILPAYATYYIDPAKINDYYSVIINTAGPNVAGFDPFRGVIYCPFQYAGNLINTGVYTPGDEMRDRQSSMINRSFYNHICYKDIPEADRTQVISKILRFTDLLETKGFDIRFKVVSYESPLKFSLVCGPNIGLAKVTDNLLATNTFYKDLRLDVRYGEGPAGLELYNASGNNSDKFAGIMNAGTGNVVDIGVTDEQFYAKIERDKAAAQQ